MLEYALSGIYSTLVTEHKVWAIAAERAYGTVVAWAGRHDMLQAAIAGAAIGRKNTALQITITDIASRANKFNSHRNRIAHGMVSSYSENGISIGYVLSPPHYASKHKNYDTLWFGEPKYRLGPADLDHFIHHFQALAREALEVRYQLNLHYK